MRGGSWNNQAQNCRAAYRNDNDPADDWNNHGLRLFAARPLGSSPTADPVFVLSKRCFGRDVAFEGW